MNSYFIILLFYVAFEQIILAAAQTNLIYCFPDQSIDLPLPDDNISYVASLNFPNGLPDVGDATCTVNIQPMPGFGVRLLFEEFFIGREDSLTIQTATDEQSIRHGSDTDPERGTVAFSLSPGPMSLTFQQTKPDVFMADVKHTGFKAILKPYNMSADEKTLCGGKRLIKDTYFETSFAYPEDYGEGNNCRWEFEGVNANLRILFYDFQTDDKTDSFVMSGDPFVMSGGSSTNETHNTTIHLGGYDVTSDLPVAFYFRGSVHVNFTSGDGSIFPPRRFSFIIDTFADQTNDTQEVCVGAESIHDLSVEKSVMINTNDYGISAYENYLKCQFNFINPPQHHVIYLQMAFESERCCDLMTVNGIGQDYIFQGERYPTIYFANSPNVSFEFSSDGVRKAVGFKGYVSTLDCACGNSSTQMVNGRRYWIKSPGFDSAPSYCPNLNCEWGFKASRNDLIEVTSHSVGLRMSDTLTIFDYNHSAIASLSAVSSSNSPKLISTVSSGSVLFQFQSIPLNMQVLSANPINGFELAVESKRIVYNRKEEIVLEENLRSFTVNISAGYSFMLHVKSTRNRTIHLYTFGSLYNTGILIDVFDGATIDAMLLDTSALYNSSNAVDSTNELQSSGSDLMFRLIGTDQINNLLTSSFNYFTFFGIVSDIVDVTYAEQCSQPLVQAFTSEAILVFERQTPTTSHATPEITTPNIPTPEITTPNLPTPEITTPNIPTPEIPTTKPTSEIPTTKSTLSTATPEISTTKPTLPTATPEIPATKPTPPTATPEITTPEIPATKPVTKLPKTTRKTTARLCTTALHHIPLQQQRQIRSGLALRVASDNPNVQLYKGITNRPQNLLTNSYPYPSFVFGDDLTFVYMSTNAPNRIRVRSTTMLGDYTLAPLSTTSHGYLYSPDYLADDDLGRIYQRYELSMESSSALGIKLEVANRINNCQVQLFGDSDGKSTLNENLLGNNSRPSYSQSVCVKHLSVIYRSNGGVNKGMLLSYRMDSDLNCSVVQSRGAVAQLHDVLFMIFSIFFMFASRTILLP